MNNSASSPQANPSSVQREPAGAGGETGIVGVFIAVLLRPGDFFAVMPRGGGYAQPLIFMVVMAVLTAIVDVVLSLLGLGGTSLPMALAGIIIAPLLVAILGFVGAAILFVIWKLMGSRETYETAYRCVAYAGAIMPFMGLLNAIPYLGIVLGLAWSTFILVIASTRVHQIAPKVAVVTFGTLAVILALGGISAQMAAQHLRNSLNNMNAALKSGQSGTTDPAQAAKALTQVLKALGQPAQSQQQGGQ